MGFAPPYEINMAFIGQIKAVKATVMAVFRGIDDGSANGELIFGKAGVLTTGTKTLEVLAMNVPSPSAGQQYRVDSQPGCVVQKRYSATGVLTFVNTPWLISMILPGLS
jgi:hypothetical protein